MKDLKFKYSELPEKIKLQIFAIASAKLGTDGDHKKSLEDAEKSIGEMYDLLKQMKEAVELSHRVLNDYNEFPIIQKLLNKALEAYNKLFEK